MRRVFNATPWPLYLLERPGTHSIGDWVDPRAGLDGCGKSHPPLGFDPQPSSPWRVAIPTELSRPLFIYTVTHLKATRLESAIMYGKLYNFVCCVL